MSTQVMDEVKGKDKKHSEAAYKARNDEGQEQNPGEHHHSRANIGERAGKVTENMWAE